MRMRVLISPKPGVLDPQGEAVEASLRQLGFPIYTVRVGRVVELDVDADDPERARAHVERACDELLANPLIEQYEIIETEGAWTT